MNRSVRKGTYNNDVPSVLKLVEEQTRKSYGDLRGGKGRIIIRKLALKMWGYI